MTRRQCPSMSKRTGEQCGASLAPGALVCRWHGGNTPQAKAKTAERNVEETARRMFGRMSEHAAPITDPFAALEQMAGEVWAWKEFCAGRIAELEAVASTDAKGTEQVAAEVSLFERALDRCTSTLAAIAKLDIDARMARISEAQADVVRRAVEAGLSAGFAAAGMPVGGEPTTAARTAVARELRRAG